MKILIAEDDPISRRILETALKKWGYEPLSTKDGKEAWEALQKKDIRLAILDWMMPEMDGISLCQRVREANLKGYVYVILLTARGLKEDLITGLEAGADDYVTKPFDYAELRSRIRVGVRTITLERQLAERNQVLAETVRKLEDSLSTIRRLHGLLPICSYCKKIRDDKNYWHRIEAYISEHSETEFSHSICPECYEKHVKPMLDNLS